MLDHLGDLRSRADDATRYGFAVDEPKLNGRRLLHAGAVSTIADVVIGHTLGALATDGARYVTIGLELHFLGAGRPGEWIDVVVEPVKIGRRLAVGNATFRCDGAPIAHATGTFMAA
jgi:uncharacterized protein (TIGR00369 family)